MEKRKGKYVRGTEVRPYVQSRTDFTNSTWSLMGSYSPSKRLYTVNSYGHFHMFIYSDETKTWYECSDKYSVTTSKHQSQAHPHCDTIKLPHRLMRVLYNYGPVGLTKWRLAA